MRLRAILREAWRNVASGTSHVGPFATVALLLFGLLALSDVVVVRLLVNDAEHYRDSGAATLTITAEGQIDGRACEQMGTLPGVTAAGAVRRTRTPLTVPALPSSPIPVYEATPGFGVLLTQSPALREGVLLGPEAAAALDLRTGEILTTADGPVTVSDLYPYPADGRLSGLSFAVVVPTLPEDGAYDECWALSWPPTADLAALLPTTIAVQDERDQAPPVLGQVNTSLGAAFDGPARYRARITAFSPPVTGIIGAVLGFAFVRRRRLELAAALHIGVARRDLLAMLLAESMLWIIPTAIGVGGITAAVAATASTAQIGALWLHGLLLGILGALGAGVGVVVASRTISERGMLRWFRERT